MPLAPGQAHTALAMALLCGGGGIYGFLKTRSLPSLVAGLTFGAAYGASAYMITHVDAHKGHALGGAASVLLAAVMGMRFIKTSKFMPAGLLTGSALLASAYHIKKAQEWA